MLFTAESAGRREVLLELLARLKLRPQEVEGWGGFLASEERLAIAIAPLDEGLLLDEVATVAESPLFGQRVMQRRRREKSRDGGDNVIKNLTELREGAPVVHIDHGVGRYQGLVTLEIEGQAQEFLLLQYADEAKLYVPVASLHLIARYTGSDDALAPLHKLGSEHGRKPSARPPSRCATWLQNCSTSTPAAPRAGYAFRTRRSTTKPSPPASLRGDAGPAGRHRRGARGPVVGQADGPPRVWRCRLRQDRSRHARRLYCRARRQAGGGTGAHHPARPAALQQLPRPLRRLAGAGRGDEPFQVRQEVQNAITELADGKIDILIGTHKLLRDDVKFSNTGTVIIDEEHRFGVRQKEQLKALRSEVDILTLTATPIPRTLNMSIAGMRDLSIIATPPARRLSVRTFVMEANNPTIKEALLRELLRGGSLLPAQRRQDHREVRRRPAGAGTEARIAIGHGQCANATSSR